MLTRVPLGTPFQQGFRAAALGRDRNPYPKSSFEHANWFFGYCIWHDAEEKSALTVQDAEPVLIA